MDHLTLTRYINAPVSHFQMSSQNSIDIEPFVPYYFCYSNVLLIWIYKCLAKFEKGISQDRNIFLNFSWSVYFCKIYTQKVQRSVSNNETWFCFWTCIMTLCYLTVWKVVQVFSYGFLYCVPIEALPVQVNGSFHTLMTLAIMQHSKHLYLVLNRDDHLMVLYIIIEV